MPPKMFAGLLKKSETNLLQNRQKLKRGEQKKAFGLPHALRVLMKLFNESATADDKMWPQVKQSETWGYITNTFLSLR